MKAVLQRVKSASVTVDNKIVGNIGKGLMILVGVGREDSVENAKKLAEKTVKLRLFPSGKGEFDLSVKESGGSILAISQFTLHADTKKGRRPGFSYAAPPEAAEPLYESYMDNLRKLGMKVEAGIFGANMSVELINDGPVTIILDTDA